MKKLGVAIVDYNAFKYYQRLSRLASYCDAHYMDKISLGQAADIAGLERTYFCTFFHQRTGTLFGDWLSRKRIYIAMTWLQESDRSVACIATAAGFQCIATFERTFKRYAGITPREFRRLGKLHSRIDAAFASVICDPSIVDSHAAFRTLPVKRKQTLSRLR